MSYSSNYKQNKFQEKVKSKWDTPSQKDEQEEQDIPTVKKRNTNYVPSTYISQNPYYRSYDWYQDYFKLSQQARKRVINKEIELLKSSNPRLSSYVRPYTSGYPYDLPLKDSHIEFLTNQNIDIRGQIIDNENQINNLQIENNIIRRKNDEIDQKINNQIALYQEAKKTHLKDLTVQEYEFSNKLNNFRNLSIEETTILNKNIKSLQDLIDQNRQVIDEERTFNHKLNFDLNNTEKKFREKSIEADLWKNKNDEEIQKFNFDIERHNRFVKELKNSQAKEISNQENQKITLRKIISNRDEEIENAKNSHAKTLAELTRANIQKRSKEIEAEIHRRQAIEIENKKNAEINLRSQIQEAEKERILRYTTSEKQLLHSRIRDLNSISIDKDIETRQWKNNYSRISSALRYRSPLLF